MPASRRALSKASAAAVRKASSFEPGLVDLAAEDGDLHVHQREAERAAALPCALEHFEHRR